MISGKTLPRACGVWHLSTAFIFGSMETESESENEELGSICGPESRLWNGEQAEAWLEVGASHNQKTFLGREEHG